MASFKKNFFVKRLLDILGSLFGMVVFAPLVIVFSVAIRWNSPGPLIYFQERVGLNGKKFNIIKMRTMHLHGDRILEIFFESNPEKENEYIKFGYFEDDPRVAGSWGRVARKYSIDEIPQFVNVLIGTMSLVGPRPLAQRDMLTFIPIEQHAKKLSVKPGMTGLWQVSRLGKRDAAINMAKFDTEYADSFSLRLDLSILLRTARAVFSGTG